jgi:hypothetical protein
MENAAIENDYGILTPEPKPQNWHKCCELIDNFFVEYNFNPSALAQRVEDFFRAKTPDFDCLGANAHFFSLGKNLLIDFDSKEKITGNGVNDVIWNEFVGEENAWDMVRPGKDNSISPRLKRALMLMVQEVSSGALVKSMPVFP